MARKKEEKKEEKEYDVLIGFVKSFNFIATDDSVRLSGHPQVGRIYRLMRDPHGWRLHIGRENNREGLDGLYLGDLDIYKISTGLIEGVQPRYDFLIEVVTPTNYLQLPIVDEDRQKLLKWLETENTDLWDSLKREQKGEATVIRSGTDLLKVLMAHKEAPFQEPHVSELNKERALEATLTLLTHFQNKSTDQLVALYDAMYGRILKTLES